MAQGRNRGNINIAQRLTGSTTQIVNDQFIEVAIVTGLLNTQTQGNNTVAIKVLGIEFEVPRLKAVDACDYEVAVYRRTKAVMPNADDKDVIKKVRAAVAFVTSGAFADPRILYWQATPGDIVIVEDPIYLGLDTTGTTALNPARVRIDFEYIEITETERLTLLARTLGVA